MRIYLIDDDSAVLGVLRLLLEQDGHTVAGSAQSAADALEDLRDCGAELVLVDLLMPDMDGISFVRRAKREFPALRFVMLSQVTSKDMVAEAYAAGVDFFLSKPIHAVEVTSVLARVGQLVTMERTMRQVRALIQADAPPAGANASPAGPSAAQGLSEQQLAQLKAVLHRLGLSGDPAYADLIQVVGFLAAQGRHEQMTVAQLCSRFSPSPKAMEQRIRRAAAAGMVNLANLGIEDYANDVFTEYAGTLFNFEQVRREMNCIRGKSGEHGKISVRRFLYALAALCSKQER